MTRVEPFVDIHCHLLPGIDDGAANWDQSLAMARMAVDDGISTIVATPHQLGSFAQNDAATIRRLASELAARLAAAHIPLKVLPGADVRIEPDLAQRLQRGEVVSLGDTGRYVLVELPHEIYFPLERLLDELTAAGYVGILSHPERNEGILTDPDVLPPLVAGGCLLQVTADSLRGAFGGRSQRLSEALIRRGLVHFVASDAHGTRRRRPQLRWAFEHVAELAGVDTAVALCCRNPAAVAAGAPVARRAVVPQTRKTPSVWTAWLGRRKAA